MARRITTLILAMLIAMSLAAPAAFGWCNGADTDGDGVGDNGYGTHDWILDNAINMAAASDRAGTAWLVNQKQTALFASDDPDSQRNVDVTLHVFRDGGIGRGAPTAIADMYYQAVQAYKAGNMAEAARCVGVLSHYYGDIAQPFHTEYDAAPQVTRHAQYETAVDGVAGNPGQNIGWITPDGFQPVTDIRAKAVSEAYFSRAKYPALLAAMQATPNNLMGNATINSISKSVLNRSTNDLADIIRTIPTAAGCASAPATIKTSTYKYYPAQNTKQCAYATCFDAAGKPIEGAAVDFTWPMKAGAKTVRCYTDPTGLAISWETIDAMPLMTKAIVTMKSKGAAYAGSYKSASTWFMPTPILADGATGIKTTTPDYTPKQYTSVTVSTVVHDKAGKIVVGLPVTFTWTFKSGTVTYTTVTDARGVARTTRNIGAATKGYIVYVKAQTQSGGINRSSTCSFKPW